MDSDNAQLSAFLNALGDSQTQDTQSEALIEDSDRVSTLPAEILREIFKLVVSQYPLGLKYISQVCSRWRDVAIGDPFLWVKPRRHPHGLTFFKIMLKRSRPAGLDIVIDSTMPKKFVEAALSRMACITSLEVHYDADLRQRWQRLHRSEEPSSDVMSPTMSLILHCLKKRSRTRLKVLKVTCESAICKQNTITLFRRIRPMKQLTRLSLTGAYFDWSMFPLPNLERLSLRATGVSQPVSMAEFLKILQKMPLLESMVLAPRWGEVISPPSDSSVEISPPHKVSLPRLQHLEFHSNTFNTSLSLLLHTDLPRIRHMVLGVGGDRTRIADSTYDTLPRALAHKIATGNFDAFNICRLRPGYSLTLGSRVPGDESNLHESYYRASQSLMTPDEPANAAAALESTSSVEITFARVLPAFGGTGQPAHMALFQDLNGEAPMDDVDIDSNLTEDDFTQFLEQPCFSSMKRLTIRDPAPYIFALSFLLGAILPQRAGDHQFVPFPDLEMIRLEGQWVGDVTPFMFKTFCDSLASRKSAGVPLKKLVLRCCSVTLEQRWSLEEGVTQLDYALGH